MQIWYNYLKQNGRAGGGLKKIFAVLKKFFNKNFLIYSLIGAINTFNTAALSALLALVLEDNVAGYLGYILSLSIGYIYNAKINFHRRVSARDYLRFMVSYIPNFLIYALITTIAISSWNWPPFWATVFAALAGVPLTYGLMRFYAFGSGNYDSPPKDDE